MYCVICKHGEVSDGEITVTLQRGPSVVVFKNVPAQICDTCGDEYLSSERNQELLARTEEVVSRGVELELLSYAA